MNDGTDGESGVLIPGVDERTGETGDDVLAQLSKSLLGVIADFPIRVGKLVDELREALEVEWLSSSVRHHRTRDGVFDGQAGSDREVGQGDHQKRAKHC
jgi:hypothetical protein